MWSMRASRALACWFALVAATSALASAHADTGVFPPMSVEQARSLTVMQAKNWMKTEPIPAYWWFPPKCVQLKPSEWECVETVYRNARGTIPYAKLTIDVWNGQLATNGNYYHHQVVAYAQRY
jgi:hypothetical protein